MLSVWRYEDASQGESQNTADSIVYNAPPGTARIYTQTTLNNHTCGMPRLLALSGITVHIETLCEITKQK